MQHRTDRLSFVTDENIDTEVLNFLRNERFDVFDIKEKGLFGMSDIDILNFAFSEKRIIISQDSDFGTLIFRDNIPFYGVIYLRPGHSMPDVHIQTLRQILDANIEFIPPCIIIGENNNKTTKIRIRYI